DDEQREKRALEESARSISQILPERFHSIASGIELGNMEAAIYAPSRRQRDLFQMSGNEQSVSGFSRSSSG
ncbi:MAG: hypothetical protein MOB07_13920, partial [Acidobacteria bacterium]|nr:hypothetical protein [Acidobacteriota bacterium]